MSQPPPFSQKLRLPERAMRRLKALQGTHAEWAVENFAEEVNELVSWCLPPDADTAPSSARVSAEFTVRSLRHYQNEGVIDPPEREGKEARYGYRHLLQALLVRRLLWEGHGRNTISALLAGRTNEDYERLLEAGVQITATPANPAVAYLEQIRSHSDGRTLRESAPAATAPRYSPPAPPVQRPLAPPSRARTWMRHELADGLEIHVSGAFRPPHSLKDRQALADELIIFLDGLRKS